MPRLLQNVSIECQKTVFEYQTMYAAAIPDPHPILDPFFQKTDLFSLNIFHFQCLWSVSLCGIWGCFSDALYPVSFINGKSWHFPHHSHFDETIGISPASDLHSIGDLHFPFSLTHYYYLKFILNSDFLRFCLMLFLFGDSTQDSVDVSLGFFMWWQFLRLSLFLLPESFEDYWGGIL